jgi:hypothetical protein
LSALLKEEKLKATEFRHRSMTDKEVHMCEPKQGSILGEDDDEMMMCSDQHKEGMLVTSSETEGSHEFQTNCLCECVLASTGDNEVEQMQGIAKEAEIQEEKLCL